LSMETFSRYDVVGNIRGPQARSPSSILGNGFRRRRR
jgi:hypothetical protein